MNKDISLARRTVILGGLTCGAISAQAGNTPDLPGRLPGPWRPGSRLDNRIRETNPRLYLFNPHTGESFSGLFYHQGDYVPAAIRHLDHFLRDWRESISVPICFRLYWGLARLTQELELTRPLLVLSGYRTQATNSKLEGAVPNSMHLFGRAVDIHSTEVGSKALYDLATSLQIGGTGWYPRGGFVHIDSGRLRKWQE